MKRWRGYSVRAATRRAWLTWTRIASGWILRWPPASLRARLRNPESSSSDAPSRPHRETERGVSDVESGPRRDRLRVVAGDRTRARRRALRPLDSLHDVG